MIDAPSYQTQFSPYQPEPQSVLPSSAHNQPKKKRESFFGFLIILLLLVVSIPTVYFVSQKQQVTEKRSKASTGPNLIPDTTSNFDNFTTRQMDKNYGTLWGRGGGTPPGWVDYFSGVLTGTDAEAKNPGHGNFVWIYSPFDQEATDYQYDVSLNPGTYTLSARAKAHIAMGGGVKVYLRCQSSGPTVPCGTLGFGETVPNSTSVFGVTGNWDSKSATFTIPALAYYRVMLSADNGAQAWFDDVELHAEALPGCFQVILNSASGKSCDEICTTAGGTCSDTGTDGNGTNGQSKKYVAPPGGSCGDTGGGCSTVMSVNVPPATCGGHPNKWTNCRCAVNCSPGPNLIPDTTSNFDNFTTRQMDKNYGTLWGRGGGTPPGWVDYFSGVLTGTDAEAKNPGHGNFVWIYSPFDQEATDYQYDVSLNPGTYTLSARAKAHIAMGGGVSVYLRCQTQPNCGSLAWGATVPNSTSVFGVTGNWDSKSATFTIPALAYYRVMLSADNGSQAWFDDIVLQQINISPTPSPTPTSPAGTWNAPTNLAVTCGAGGTTATFCWDDKGAPRYNLRVNASQTLTEFHPPDGTPPDDPNDQWICQAYTPSAGRVCTTLNVIADLPYNDWDVASTSNCTSDRVFSPQAPGFTCSSTASPTPTTTGTPRPNYCSSASYASNTGSQFIMLKSTANQNVNKFFYYVYNEDNQFGGNTDNPKGVCVTTGGDITDQTANCPAGSHTLIFQDQDTTTMRTTGQRIVPYDQLFDVIDKNNGGAPLTHPHINAYFKINDGNMSASGDACVTHPSKTENTYSAYNVTMPSCVNTGSTITATVQAPNATAISFPMWDINGWQDDVVWHNATKNGDTWSVTVNQSLHPNGTPIYVGCYYSDSTFTNMVCDATGTYRVGVPCGAITPTITPTTAPVGYIAGDINRDGAVNALDYSILLSNWYPSADGDYTEPTDWRADIDSSGLIDVSDYAILFEHYGQEVSPTPTPYSDG